MGKLLFVVVPFVALFGFFTLQELAKGSEKATDGGRTININIQVSPSTIFKSSKGGRVTVQTDIKYSLVDKNTIQLNGISPKGTKTNARGYMVAYFDLNDIKSIVFPPSALLEFTGLTVNGDDFYGLDLVRVTN
jgi:hypothetical protein